MGSSIDTKDLLDRIHAPNHAHETFTYESGSSPTKDRKKAPPFHECELRLLMQLYCNSYEEYHGRGAGKFGPNDKKLLLRRFAQEVSNLGFHQRTEKQIEERLRADCKRVRKHERARIHEGQEAVLNSLPTYLHQLYECRRNRTVANGSALHDDDDINEDDAANTPVLWSNHLEILTSAAWNKADVITPGETTPVCNQLPPTTKATIKMEDDVDSHDAFASSVTTVPPPRKIPRKYTKAMRSFESPTPSTDRRSTLCEEEIKLSLLRQQLAMEELKLLVIKNDLARAQLERETIATERERFELERAKQEQNVEELQLLAIKQELARVQLEKEQIALERERLKLELEKVRASGSGVIKTISDAKNEAETCDVSSQNKISL